MQWDPYRRQTIQFKSSGASNRSNLSDPSNSSDSSNPFNLSNPSNLSNSCNPSNPTNPSDRLDFCRESCYELPKNQNCDLLWNQLRPITTFVGNFLPLTMARYQKPRLRITLDQLRSLTTSRKFVPLRPISKKKSRFIFVG